MEIRMDFTFLRGNNLSASLCSAPPLVKGRLWVRKSKAPLVKGSWRGAPEGLPRRSGPKAPSDEGAVSEAD